jgi:hypothetical protein
MTFSLARPPPSLDSGASTRMDLTYLSDLKRRGVAIDHILQFELGVQPSLKPMTP